MFNYINQEIFIQHLIFHIIKKVIFYYIIFVKYLSFRCY